MASTDSSHGTGALFQLSAMPSVHCRSLISSTRLSERFSAPQSSYYWYVIGSWHLALLSCLPNASEEYLPVPDQLTAIFGGLFAGAQSRLNHGGSHATPPSDGHTACQSEDCVLTAASIIKSVDRTIKPCDDFYSFAAGGWLKDINHRIPDDAGLFGTGQLVASQNRRLILDILNAAPSHNTLLNDDTDLANLAKLKTFYSSCVETAAQDKLGSQPLLELIREMRDAASRRSNHLEANIDGGSEPFFFVQGLRSGSLPKPSVGASPLPLKKAPVRAPRPHPPAQDPTAPGPSGGRQKAVTSVISWAHSRGLWVFWEVRVDGDPIRDPNEGTVYLYPGGLGLPNKEYYTDQDELDFYQKAVEQALLAVDSEESNGLYVEESTGKSKEKASKGVHRLAREVVEIEKELARFTPNGDVLADPVATYNPVAVNKLEHHFDGISWPDYLSALTVRVPKKVVVTSPEFFKRLNELFSRTRDDVVEAYLTWTIVRTYGTSLGPKASLRRPAEAVKRHALGVDPDTKEDQEMECLAAIDESLGFMAGRYFVQRAFPQSARRKAETIISTIVDAFKSRLPELEWLDEKTREAAQVKADKIRIKVGWPDSPNTTDAASIARYYENYRVKEGDHFGNQVRSAMSSVRRVLSQAGRKLDPLRWDMVPQEVNAYYNPGGAEIVFPAGILQAPYFDVGWPEYLQWGAFGAVSGHELSHAFDPTGRLYDKDGYLRDWWSEETAREFTKRQRCLEYQYGNYTLDDGAGKKLPLNPKQTIGEDVADAGGVAQSYRAWRARLPFVASDNLLLAGLEHYTREQLFFVAYGISYARNLRPAEALRRIRTDPHSPNRYRVNAVLTNFEPFHRAFGCKSGDALFTPKEDTCQIW